MTGDNWNLQAEKLKDDWGSLDCTGCTLLAWVSRGKDWVQSVAGLNKHSSWHRAAFTFYIVLVMSGIFNFLTDVFAAETVEFHAFTLWTRT